MTNLQRTLVTTSLIIVIAAPSTGCGAVRLASLASKAGKVGKVATLSKASKVVVASGRSVRLAKALQASRVRTLRQGGSVDTFVPDEVADTFVVAAKDEAGFAGIYGRPPTYAELISLRSRVRLVAAANGDSQEVFSAGEGIESFISYLDKSPSKNIIVIGHNQGGVFYFANGESMHLADMARLINEHNKRGIFLSCQAKKYVPNGYPASRADLTHDEAIKILNNLSEKLRDEAAQLSHSADNIALAGEDAQLLGEQHVPGKLLDIREQRVHELIQETIDSAESSASVNRSVKRVAKSAAGGGFVYYVVKLTSKRGVGKRNSSTSRGTGLPVTKIVP